MGILATLGKLFKRAPAERWTRPEIDAVFSLSAVPSIGYVARTGRKELNQIGDAITTRGKSVVVLGPAKVGKSVFVNKTIGDSLQERAVELSGRSVQSIDEFWSKLVMASGGYVEDKITTETDVSSSVGAKSKIKVGHDLMKVSAELSGSASESRTTTVERKRIYDLRTLGEQFLTLYAPVVLFEDFHEIESEKVRQQIASISKEFAEKERAKFVFVSTSEPEIRLFRQDAQLRASVYEFPTWSVSELNQIISDGFAKLNCQINEAEVYKLQRESFGSPCTLSDLCATTAKSARRRVGDKWNSISPITIHGADVAAALEAQVSEYSSFARLPVLALESSSVADKPTRYTINGVQGTIYHLILEALRRTGYAEPQGVGQDAIRNRIREILRNEKWTSATLADHLAVLAATDIRIEHRVLFGRLPERPMSYDRKGAKFFVNDPTLRTYLYRGGTFHAL